MTKPKSINQKKNNKRAKKLFKKILVVTGILGRGAKQPNLFPGTPRNAQESSTPLFRLTVSPRASPELASYNQRSRRPKPGMLHRRWVGLTLPFARGEKNNPQNTQLVHFNFTLFFLAHQLNDVYQYHCRVRKKIHTNQNCEAKTCVTSATATLAILPFFASFGCIRSANI